MLPTIARARGLREVRGEQVDNILRGYLQNKRLLLVLDNFEQVPAAASAVAGNLLNSCPNLKVLVTSRTLLHAYGEHDFNVPPLEHAGPGSPAAARPPDRV